MFVKSLITECDFTDKTYNTPVWGADVLVQGATGRFCCVMTAGPEYIRKNKIKPISNDRAVEECMTILRNQNNDRPEVGRYSDDEMRTYFIDF